ncbi:MAG: AraC family transcriptional regulator ligand-binding domain-containing protein [Motiliproteus sp.]
MTPGQFRTAYIHKLLSVIEQQGIDVEPFYRLIGLTPERVRDRMETSRQDYEKVQFQVIDDVDLPGLGLFLGASVNLSDLSLAGLAFMFSSDLERGIKRWTRFQELTDPPHNYRFYRGEAQSILRANINLEPFQANIKRNRFAIEESLSEWMKAGELFDRPYGWFSEIHLNYPKPDYANLYEAHFNCPVKFDQPNTQFLFSSKYLNAPMRHGDEDIAQILEFKCAALIKASRGQDELVYTIRTILMRDPEKYKHIGEIASVLNVSERTLRRRLTELGTTFKDIAFNYRMTLACEYLVSTDLPISAVSYMVGYSDTANFFRAFRQHADMTPDQYRIGHAKSYCQVDDKENSNQ